jgi:hypothetical protein
MACWGLANKGKIFDLTKIAKTKQFLFIISLPSYLLLILWDYQKEMFFLFAFFPSGAFLFLMTFAEYCFQKSTLHTKFFLLFKFCFVFFFRKLLGLQQWSKTFCRFFNLRFHLSGFIWPRETFIS